MPDFEVGKAAVVPAARRAPAGRRPCAATTRSSCRPTARAGCTRRPGCSTARCPATTSRTSPRSATRCTASRPTRPARCSRGRTTTPNPSGDEPGAEVFPYVFTTYRLTEHHTAGGMSRWQPYLVRAAAGVLLRGLPGAGPRARAGAPRLGHDRQRPHRDRGAGAGHRAGRPRCRSAAGRSTRSACRTTGASVARQWSAATRPTTCSGSPSTRTSTSRSPRWPPATSSRAADRAGPALLEYVEDYRRRAGITPRHRATSSGPRRSGPTAPPRVRMADLTAAERKDEGDSWR